MSIIDFTDTIIAKSDQLNAADIAGSMTIKITDAKRVSDPDQPIQIFYESGGNKPWKPCKTMRRVMAKVWGSKVDLKGKLITLVCDPKVTWGGAEVGGIRITHMSGIEKEVNIPVRVSRHKVEPYKIIPIKDQPAPEALVKAGNEAAAKGVAAYTAWKDSLNPDDKNQIRTYHTEWARQAKAFDEQNKPAPEEEVPFDTAPDDGITDI